MQNLQLLWGRVRTAFAFAEDRPLAIRSRQMAMWSMQLNAMRTAEGRQTLRRSTLPLLAFVAGYLGAYAYGIGLSSPAPLWPPNAILLSALLLTPARHWWIFLLLTLPIRMAPPLAPGVPGWLLLVNWLNDTLTVLLAAALVRRLAPYPLRFTTLRAMGIYLVSAALLAPLVSAFIGAAGLAALGTPYWQAWRTWFLGDALACLVLTPTIVMWASTRLRTLRPPSRQRATEAILLGVALLIAGGLLVYTEEQLIIESGLYYLALPLLAWAAVRFGPLGIASALTFVTCFAVADFAGLWGIMSTSATSHDVFSLQLFLIASAVPLLLLAAQIEERRQSEVRFRAAFESAATGMMLVDPTGHILQANRRLVEMLGYSEAELRAHTFVELTYPDDREPNLMLFRQAVASEIDSYQLEKRYLQKDGTILWARVSAGVVRDTGGQTLYFVGQIEDITGRKVLEHEREEARASELALRETKTQMDTFLSIASHELKTPLTSLKLSVQSSQRQLRKLIHGAMTPLAAGEDTRLHSAVEQLGRTAHQIGRMEALVNDLVDVSRIQAGRLELRLEHVDLVSIVQVAVAAQQEAVPDRRLLLQHAGGLSVLVTADAGRIEQVVINYLTNALKYSPSDRPVEVGVDVESQEVRVWVRDQGSGLPIEEQEQIWERFHRAKGIEVQAGAGVGLGLGLHISRMIVERHHGQVGVQSSPGQGATFWFTLPLHQNLVEPR